MANITCIRRIALYDNSRKDENNNPCIIRLPWDLVTMAPGLSGAPTGDYLEPVPVNLSSTPGKTETVEYHGINEIDAKNIYVAGNGYGTGGENRADA